MAINFPSNPNVNDTHVVGSTIWTWDGSSWNGVSHDPIEIATLTYPSVDGTAGQLLITDGAGNLSFGNLSPATLSTVSIDALSDVDITSVAPTDGQVLVWDNASSTFIPGSNAGYSDSSVDTHLNTSAATSNQVLSWDGSDYAWVAASSGTSGAFSTTYDQVQIETTTPNTDSLNELWFNPDTATWSKSIQNPTTGAVLDTQVASIGGGGPSIVFPSTTSGTIFFGYGLYSSNGVEVVFTTPLWLVSYSHPSFDAVEIHSYILEDDTEVVLYPNAPSSYSNNGTDWATQRVKSLKFTSGYRANNTNGTLIAAGAPIWDELEQTFDKPIVIDGVIETSTALTGATGTVVHDTSNSHIFTHSSIAADFTANFTNLSLVANQTTALTLVLTQGATAYIPTAVEIGGTAQTILWQGGSAPSGTASGTDVVTFSIIYNGSSYTVLGNLASYS